MPGGYGFLPPHQELCFLKGKCGCRGGGRSANMQQNPPPFLTHFLCHLSLDLKTWCISVEEEAGYVDILSIYAICLQLPNIM